MYTEDWMAQVATLQQLNDELRRQADRSGQQAAFAELTYASFTGGRTPAQIDQAITALETAASLDELLSGQLVTAIDNVPDTDLVAPVVPEPEPVAAAQPTAAEQAGYFSTENSGYYAWVKDACGIYNDAAALKLLVSAVNGLGSAEHASAKCRGLAVGATYVHAPQNQLYAYQIDATPADDWPWVTVYKSGNVNAGVHVFK